MALFIGIDPGVNTGLAIWDGIEKKLLRVETIGIITAMVELVEFIRYRGVDREDVHFIVEDARKRTWIPLERDAKQIKGRAMGAGSVKRDCSIWEEFCQHFGYDLQLIPPRSGATKWTAEAFARVTGWQGRTSNHARDAAMLVFGKC